jgi:hypothetical protein
MRADSADIGPEATPVGASVSSDRTAQDRSMPKPDEFIPTPIASLGGRAASRATNAYKVRAAEIVLTDRIISKSAD